MLNRIDMNTRFFHGDIVPNDLAIALLANFDQGNFQAQQIGSGDEIVIQITTSNRPISGGQTAIAVSLKKITDGVMVQVGKQSWLGVAASLGKSVLMTWKNPFSLITRLDDIAQDVENLQIADQIWEIIENTTKAAGASFMLSDRLRRIVCQYCNVANPIGESNCLACGGPLGSLLPDTCRNCGFVISTSDIKCPNCGYPTS